MKRRTVWDMLLILALVLTLTGCVRQEATAPRAVPRALAGVLDLRTWDLARDGVVKLRG